MPLMRSATMRDDGLRAVTGPEAVKAQHAIQALQNQRDKWPYAWLCPPEEAVPVFRVGQVVSPLVNTETLVLEYTVPAGMQFALVAMAQLFSGAGYIPGSGDIVWTTDTDAPVGFTAIQGSPLPGMFELPIPLGGFLGSALIGGLANPWVFPMPFLLKQNQVLRNKVTTFNSIPDGVPNYMVSAFSGFTWPAE